MIQPNQFILTAEFSNLKNDATPSASQTIPSAVGIAGNGSYLLSVDATAGQIGALARARISSSKAGSLYQVGNNALFNRTGVSAGNPAPYSVFAFVYRVAPTTIRFQIFIPNPYSDPLTCEAGIETINIYANTFIAPYA